MVVSILPSECSSSKSWSYWLSRITVYLSLPESPFISACQISRHQPISPNRCLCRLARNHGITRSYCQVSWHKQVRQITTYLGSPYMPARPVDVMSVMPARIWWTPRPNICRYRPSRLYGKTGIAHAGNMSMGHWPGGQYVKAAQAGYMSVQLKSCRHNITVMPKS